MSTKRIDDIKRASDIVDVIRKVTDLKRNGNVFKGLCPFHNERTPSFVVYPKTQRFACFGCGKKGDVVDFVRENKHVELTEALNLLDTNATLAPVRHDPPKDADDGMEFLSPAPAPPRTIKHPSLGTPAHVWPYSNADSELLFYVCRWDKEDGSKDVIPYTPWKKGRRIIWRFKGIPYPRPIYGLNRIQAGQTIGIFEGEKTADAAQALFPHVSCISWQGGSKAIKKTDWAPIFGRNILIFPDFDQPGLEAMLELYSILAPHCPVIKAIKPLPIKKGWDFADWAGTSDEAILYAKSNIVPVPDFVLEPIQQQPSEESPEPVEYPVESLPFDTDNSGYIEQIENMASDGAPYRSLGFQNMDHTILYWFFSFSTQSIVAYRSPQLSKDDIIKEIAPANYWEYHFGGRNGKINGSMIAEKLRRECASAGFFDSSMIRGRGAWIDHGHFILHAGDYIIKDGKKHQISTFPTKYAYQTKPSLGLDLVTPLKPAQASKLMEVMNLFNWERRISSTLAAGWCVIAPFCGTLKWRPHIWVIGGAATGKSWILSNVFRKALGKLHFAVQSKTTEAAIRQTSGGDALPIIFDELEAENEMDALRVQGVIDLARSSSSQDGGSVVKGSTSGKSAGYQVRFCFCFASIAQTIKHRSDEGRITTLALGSSTPEEKQANALKVSEIMTPEFADGLIARTISLMPVLQTNISTFSRAAASVLGDTRAGDQIGPMLAGAYLLKRSDEIGFDDAVEWIKKHDWSEDKPRSENRDEVRLLQTILEKQIRCDGKVSVERTVGELIYVSNGTADAAMSPDAAIDKLLRLGISSKPDGIYISIHSNEIKKNILKGTSWALNFPKILARLEGSSVHDSIKFSPGTISRAVFVPREHYTVNP
jgi:putative DNA primase/helicase